MNGGRGVARPLTRPRAGETDLLYRRDAVGLTAGIDIAHCMVEDDLDLGLAIALRVVPALVVYG